MRHTEGMSEQTDFAKEPELTLGWRIQMALDKGNLKQADLMSKFEVSRGTVSRWCRDIAPAPKKFVLNEIAVMCGVPARWLIDGESSKPTPPDGGGRLRESNPGPSHYQGRDGATITPLFGRFPSNAPSNVPSDLPETA